MGDRINWSELLAQVSFNRFIYVLKLLLAIKYTTFMARLMIAIKAKSIAVPPKNTQIKCGPTIDPLLYHGFDGRTALQHTPSRSRKTLNTTLVGHMLHIPSVFGISQN